MADAVTVNDVICVLKTGGEYRPEHVYRLWDSLRAHNPGARLRCLTDAVLKHPSVDTVPLLHHWPGWWSKIELFRPGVCTGPTLYLDLDTVVVGRIELDISKFTMLEDVYRPGDFGSGIMAWSSAPEHIYHRFLERPTWFMTVYRTRDRWGDQAFIRDNLGETPNTFGPQFRSYKAHCKNGVPPGTRVVYFHGRPRPWQVNLQGFKGPNDG